MDFFDMLVVGTKVICKGEEYIALVPIPTMAGSFYLAVKPKDTIPAQIYLVEADITPKEKT